MRKPPRLFSTLKTAPQLRQQVSQELRPHTNNTGSINISDGLGIYNDCHQPWQVLGQGLGFANPNQKLLWNTGTAGLGKSMIKAQYPVHLQCLYLSFHKFILPSLDGNSDGLASWKTLLTHDGFPIEPNLNFTQSGLTVRFTVVPETHLLDYLGIDSISLPARSS